MYARLSETYDAAESVPTQLANADRHAERRGWRWVARFKDDGYSAVKEIRRDDFVNLIEAIERDEIDVVIIRDVDRLTRNLPDWSRFEKAAVEPPATGISLDVPSLAVRRVPLIPARRVAGVSFRGPLPQACPADLGCQYAPRK